jgi:uncharacterized protein HemY
LIHLPPALKQARWQDAEEFLRQSLKVASRDLSANLAFHQCLLQLGEEEEAKHHK